ncbi:lytic polysaccharide monooxygenase [Streptomyces sp. VNUA116]|uniref:lytic polysaccharide monooxygenase n=1 Tax=Streptomyces sp. VNUA116 TaxID=3062449 RepID=UPI002674EA21|nr:lytic polysaccharide monooxygenase [Streptomyces sp. VNUA116]WKU42735.1 lytic polysaccharide monooxygenase [Streptomyces sp. VNUA116]
MSSDLQSRQEKYLMPGQYPLSRGKFIRETNSGISDPEFPADIVNNTPPQDQRIASADNPHALKLDGVLDEDGQPWTADRAKSGQAITLSYPLSVRLIRRSVVYITKPSWDPQNKLTRAQFDLDNPVLTNTYTATPYYQAGEQEIPNGLKPTDPYEISFNLPTRPDGHHVLLVEIDLPDRGDAIYSVYDLRYGS